MSKGASRVDAPSLFEEVSKLMADAQSILHKFIKTLIGGLIIGAFCWLTIYVIILLLGAFHILVPAFVVPIVGLIFLLLFVLFVCRVWGFNFTF